MSEAVSTSNAWPTPSSASTTKLPNASTHFKTKISPRSIIRHFWPEAIYHGKRSKLVCYNYYYRLNSIITVQANGSSLVTNERHYMGQLTRYLLDYQLNTCRGSLANWPRPLRWIELPNLLTLHATPTLPN